ncbi:hypothetical protein Tco_1493729 [Tanacetum coccineum]
MSSITAQQTKLDLELVPKEKRLQIGKCNGRLNPGKKQREPTFQVVLDALALTLCYSTFLTTTDVPKVYMHQFWDSIHKYDTSYRYSVFSFKECEGHRWGVDHQRATPPKKRKFKKHASPKLTTVPKLNMKKFKKSLRDFHKTSPSSSGTATKIAPSAAKIKPSVTNEGTGAKPGGPDSDSGDDNTQSDNEKGSDSEHETDENETGSESDQEENEEQVEDDEEEKDDEFVKTPSNSTDDEDETNKAEGDEDKGIDYTTNQFDDESWDVSRINQLIQMKGFIQKEGTDAEMKRPARK